MPRRRVAERREILPDPVFNSEMVTKFINSLMWQGKKTLAENIFYRALEVIREKTEDDPLKVFKRAVENVRPRVEVRSRRVGGATYQVPVEVDQRRRGAALSIRWLVSYSRERSEKTMVIRLAAELMDAANSEISDDLCEYVLHLYEFACYFYNLVSETIFDFGYSVPMSKSLITNKEKEKIKVKNNVIQFDCQEFKISDEFQSLIENGLDVVTAIESIHDQIEWMLCTPSTKSARNHIIN